MTERNAKSEDEDNIYTEATREANEILFGNQASPEKPWTEKVASKRKKLVLQLIDQKLKFKLVDLMSQFGKQNQTRAYSSKLQQSRSHNVDFTSSINVKLNYSVEPQCKYNAFKSQSGMYELSDFTRPYLNSIHPHNVVFSIDSTNLSTPTGEVANPDSTEKQAVSYVNCEREQNKYAIDITDRPSTDLLRKVSTECTTVWLRPFRDPTPTGRHLVNFQESTTNDQGDLRNQLLEKKRKREQFRFSSQENFQVKDSKKSKQDNEDGDSSETISVEWNKMKKLFTKIIRTRFLDLTLIDYQYKVAILVRMSVDPDAFRYSRTFSEKLFDEEIDRFIEDCKHILFELNGADSEVQSNFYSLRDKMILDIRSSQADHDAENYQPILRKIQSIIDPLLYSHKLSKLEEKERKEMAIELMKNPHALEYIKMANIQKGSMENVMHEIKNVLDEFIVVRRPKNFYFPKSKYFDIPFVVHLTDKSGKMNQVDAAALRNALLNLINLEKPRISTEKPKILEIKYNAGILIIACANRLTFDWIEKTVTTVNFHGRWSNAKFNVEFVGVKNVIPINSLKTIFAKFNEPQFRHFNYLMAQLQLENPSLRTERWELRGLRGKNMDSPNSMYIGVDVESLIALEGHSRVAFVGKSMVSFNISYDENEEHFELIPRKRKINKIYF